jgi:hypothetical protein
MLATALVCALSAPLAAQGSHPSFAGTWTLDSAKTVIDGQAPPPSSATRTVTQHGDTIVIDNTMTTAGNTQTTHLVWGLDGKPWANSVTVGGGQQVDVSSVLTWAGDTLVIRSSLSVQGTDVEQLDRWVLAPDGKSVVTIREVSAMGTVVSSSQMTYVKKS